MYFNPTHTYQITEREYNRCHLKGKKVVQTSADLWGKGGCSSLTSGFQTGLW